MKSNRTPKTIVPNTDDKNIFDDSDNINKIISENGDNEPRRISFLSRSKFTTLQSGLDHRSEVMVAPQGKTTPKLYGPLKDMEEEQKKLDHPPTFDSSYHRPNKIDEKQRDAKTYGDHLTPFKERNILEESPSDGKSAFKSTGHRDDNSTLRLQAAKDQHNMFVGEPIVCASHNDVVDPSMPKFELVLPNTSNKTANFNLRIEASHQSHNLDKYEDPKDAMAHEGEEGNMNTIYHKRDKFEEMATGKRLPFTSELERQTKMKEIERPLNPPPLTEQPNFQYLPKVNKKQPTKPPPMSKTKTGGNKTSPSRKVKDNSTAKSNTINNTARMVLQKDVSELPTIPSPSSKVVDEIKTPEDNTMSHNVSEDSLTFNSSVMVNRQSTIISFLPRPKN